MTRHFGGSWTEQKLDVVEDYLRAYLTALKKQKFSLGYIDAFAGDGSILLATSDDEGPGSNMYGDDSIRDEVAGLIRGSAQRALELEPGFDGFVFIEKDKKAARQLEQLKVTYPAKARQIRVRCGDANSEIQQICRTTDWSGRRAVVFLDPAGMQVAWETMEAIAATEAIDVWSWFPLGVGVNRLLPRSGDIDPVWRDRLNRIFGTTDWEGAFYDSYRAHTLFDGLMDVTVKKASPQHIAEYYNERLKTIFPAVAPNPRIMRNSKRNPLYLLCFAAANPGMGGKIAVGIAKHLLNKA